ncbi:MAG: ribokinase [Acidimicrobiia bacterium]|nr:ribokinase [Acidimicrobiia bacterium]MDH4307983.1 ribokinase [Acidimicrobiia bacterium]MDH5292406.1 ribokinase [Acidimicrobiia bacterium]
MSHIGVVGSVNLDVVATCARLPRPGETVTGATIARHPGGKGANQALAARRLGAATSLIARVGKDAYAEEAMTLLRASGVDLSRAWRDPSEPTGLALIAVDENGENQIVVAPGANARLRPADVNVAGLDAVICQFEIPTETVEAAAEQCTGLFCLNAAPARHLSGPLRRRPDLIVVNEVEHAELESDLTGFEGLVAVTTGASGAALFRRGRLVARATPPRVTVVDTVGAGDSFVAALVVSMLEGRSAQDSLTRACAAGALATTRPGAQPSLPTADELDHLLGGTLVGDDRVSPTESLS